MDAAARERNRLRMRRSYALKIAKSGRVVNPALGRRRFDEQLQVDSVARVVCEHVAAAGRVLAITAQVIRDHGERSAAAAFAAETSAAASAAALATQAAGAQAEMAEAVVEGGGEADAEGGGEVEAEGGGEAEAVGGGEAEAVGGGEADAVGGGEAEAVGGGEGEAQATVPACGLLGLTDDILSDQIMSRFYGMQCSAGGEAMFYLLRVKRAWPGRDAHRRGLLEVRCTQRRLEVKKYRLAAALRLAKVKVGMLVLGAPWSQDQPPQVLWRNRTYMLSPSLSLSLRGSLSLRLSLRPSPSPSPSLCPGPSSGPSPNPNPQPHTPPYHD